MGADRQPSAGAEMAGWPGPMREDSDDSHDSVATLAEEPDHSVALRVRQVVRSDEGSRLWADSSAAVWDAFPAAVPRGQRRSEALPVRVLERRSWDPSDESDGE